MRLILVLGAMLWLTGCAPQAATGTAGNPGSGTPASAAPAATAIPGAGEMPVAQAAQPPSLGYIPSQGCAAVPVPAIEVKIVESGPAEDRSRGYRELTQTDLSANGTADQGGRRTFGLTRTDIAATGDLKMLDMRFPNGDHCVYLQRMTIRLTWDFVIFVAKEFPADSCAAQAIRAHEDKHVSLDRQMQPMLQRWVMAALLDRGQRSELASDTDLAETRLRSVLDDTVKTEIDAFRRELNRQQERVDSDAEYHRVQAVCGKPAFDKFVD